MESLSIVRLWAAAAWADGTLDPREAAALKRYIEASPELHGEERREALALLDGKPDVDVAEARALSPTAREGVYRAALGIVRLDRKVTPDEEAWLGRLRAVLDLDPATLRRIEAETG
jgi:tellurite resistance protein